VTRPLLKDALHRVFVLRSQIVHGSSSAGSRLNREVVSDCLEFLQPFVPLAISIALFHGAEYDWPRLCYPPVDPRDGTQLRKLRR
jgi:hypothetical protein